MCISNNFIEQEAYEYSEKIRKNSSYIFVRKVMSEDKNGTTEGGLTLITKIILEDKDGTIYSVAPNPNGLKFAKQEITYKEYKRLQNKETRNAIIALVVILVCFSTALVTLMRFFT